MKKLLIKDIKFKNFMSYGEQGGYIDFTRNQMTIATGLNGQGKSSIYESLVFALYGKTIRKIPKADIVNTKNNKSCLVTVNFTTSNKDYKVIRGIKPNKFEIYQDGTLLKQDASVKEYQLKLEDIIGINYKTFLQTVIISKTNYTPFMKLDSATRRTFVEELLTLSIFGLMSKKQKLKLKVLKEKFTEVSTDYKIAQSNIEQAERNVKQINKILLENSNEKAKFIENQINEILSDSRTITDEAKTLKNTLYDGVDEIYKKYIDSKTKLSVVENKIVSLNNKKDTYTHEGHICLECGQPLTEKHINEHLSKIEKQLNELLVEKNDLLSFISNNSNIDDMVKHNTKVNTELAIIRDQLKQYKQKHIELKKEQANITIDETELDKAKEELKNYRDSFSKHNSQLSKVKKKIETNVIVNDMLKDSGIKSSIINKSIPLINHTINKNLSKFGFFVDFKLDSEFNETIKQRGIDTLKYDSYSEGEKLRMDMAILLAWREVAQTRANISCNLMLFDEMTDASMDFDGSDILGSMLSELEDTNVFIITHTPEKLENYARGTIKIEKTNGYSRIL